MTPIVGNNGKSNKCRAIAKLDMHLCTLLNFSCTAATGLKIIASYGKWILNGAKHHQPAWIFRVCVYVSISAPFSANGNVNN